MELSRREELLSYISDVFKDINGFRPCGMGYNDMSIAELEAAASRLSDECMASEAEDRKWERRAQERFEAVVANTIAYGAGDRETALRWLFDAEGLDESDLWYGADWISYKFGVGYHYNLRTGETDPSRNFNYEGLLCNRS